eukprot:Hpha_TRINITY_DN15706_c2_g4::TRINITY_DN15706_c2_g4_i2::g.37535::m.37535
MGDPPNPPPPPPPRGSPGLGRLEGRETAVISKKGQNEFQQVLANNMRKMVCAGKGPGPCGDTSHASCPPPDPHQESPLALLPPPGAVTFDVQPPFHIGSLALWKECRSFVSVGKNTSPGFKESPNNTRRKRKLDLPLFFFLSLAFPPLSLFLFPTPDPPSPLEGRLRLAFSFSLSSPPPRVSPDTSPPPP